MADENVTHRGDLASAQTADAKDKARADQIALICGEITDLAQAIARLAGDQVMEDAADFDVNKAVSIRALALQAGWLADLCSTKVGGMTFGDAEKWMLPPMYHQAGEVPHG